MLITKPINSYVFADNFARITNAKALKLPNKLIKDLLLVNTDQWTRRQEHLDPNRPFGDGLRPLNGDKLERRCSRAPTLCAGPPSASFFKNTKNRCPFIKPLKTLNVEQGNFAHTFQKEFILKAVTTFCLYGLMVFFASLSNAEELSVTPQNNPLIPYVVSAVLRKADTATVIKLLQSLQLQASPEAAEKALLDQVLTDYLGYVVITTLVTPVSELIIPVKPKAQHPLSS